MVKVNVPSHDTENPVSDSFWAIRFSCVVCMRVCNRWKLQTTKVQASVSLTYGIVVAKSAENKNQRWRVMTNNVTAALDE